VGKASRAKGAVGERELCKLLSGELGITVSRNVDQARNGGADCLELKGFAIECKRQERLSRPAWWAQAVAQGEKCKAEPIVFYRRSREPWQALIRAADGNYREATWEAAMLHIREKLARLYGIYKEAA
jgi:predicted molibdopterin-dependent oxidoreductase YjgC